MDVIISFQHSIGWNYFIRCRVSKLFTLFIPKHYKTNKFGKHFKATTWMKYIIQGVWNIHLNDWNTFCYSTFDTSNWTIGDWTIKITFLKLVTKYYGKYQVLELLLSKQILFKRDIKEYRKLSVEALWR